MTDDEIDTIWWMAGRMTPGEFRKYMRVVSASIADTAKPVQVIPLGVMGIPPNPPGSASMTIRHDVPTRNASIADTAGASEDDVRDAKRWRMIKRQWAWIDTELVDAAIAKESGK